VKLCIIVFSLFLLAEAIAARTRSFRGEQQLALPVIYAEDKRRQIRREFRFNPEQPHHNRGIRRNVSVSRAATRASGDVGSRGYFGDATPRRALSHPSPHSRRHPERPSGREGSRAEPATLDGARQGRSLRKSTPPLVIPKPVLWARNLLSSGSETADSSRDNAALRNDNSLKMFELHHRSRPSGDCIAQPKRYTVQDLRRAPAIYTVRLS
jgi:hypothetical protein